MVSLDRQVVSPLSQQVHCPLRDKPVAIAKCLQCSRLIDTDKQQPPRYIVCDARMINGWLGLDDV